jgi:hypothetical protein
MRGLALRRRVFFCSNVASHSSPHQRRAWLLIIVCFFCSSDGGPQGHDNKELGSSSLCFFFPNVISPSVDSLLLSICYTNGGCIIRLLL